MMAMTTGEDSSLVSLLHDQCPTFFGRGDVLHYRAVDCMKKAKLRFGVRRDRDRLLEQALELYRQAARNRDFPLADICKNLREVHYYQGVVELSLFRAQLLERGEVAAPRPSSLLTTRAINGFDAPVNESGFIESEKKKCFDTIIESLDILIFNQYRDPRERMLHEGNILDAF
jgi:hypothetical protein